MMTAEEYQAEVNRTMTLTDRDETILMCGLGVPDEAGEVAGAIKKWYFQGHALDSEHLKEEIGDVTWYLTVLATALGFNLSDIFEANRDKLRKRYPNGFSTAASLARADVEVTRV
jgi:NTP pyrophosphatase (non-canonical NTP hydrolase)